MRKHLISGLLALYLLLCLPLSAAAHAVPDESQDGHCSITITMTYKGKAVPGGTLALYKVGDVVEAQIPRGTLKLKIEEISY